MDALTFNEAKLRGIDLKKLQEESFTSMQHIIMVKDHEARKRITADWKLFKELPEYVPAKREKPSTSTRVVTNKKTMSFTDVQLKIAIEALGKK